MQASKIFLEVAKDEIETLITYHTMIEVAEEPDEVKEALDEIIGDEFNHALIALVSAAKLLNIKIAEDDIKPDPNDIQVDNKTADKNN